MSALFCELRKDLQKRRLFQTAVSQRSVLVSLTLEAISRSDTFVVDIDDSCLCGKSYKDLFSPLMSVFANVILNNYRKKINDMTMQRKVSESSARKRKNETENDGQPKSKKSKCYRNRKALTYKNV